MKIPFFLSVLIGYILASAMVVTEPRSCLCGVIYPMLLGLFFLAAAVFDWDVGFLHPDELEHGTDRRVCYFILGLLGLGSGVFIFLFAIGVIEM